MKFQTESMPFANDVASGHYTKINSKNKKKFNAIEFRDFLYSAHLTGMAEALQILLTVGKEIEESNIPDREKFDLLIGEMEILWVTAGKEFISKYPNKKHMFPADICSLKKVVQDSWSIRLAKEEDNEKTAQETLH